MLSRKSSANIGYAEGAVGAVLGLTILSAISLLVVVLILGTSPLNNTTGVSGIQTNFVSFVGNIFTLLPVVGTMIALSIMLAVIVVVFVFVKKMRGSGMSDEFSG